MKNSHIAVIILAVGTVPMFAQTDSDDPIANRGRRVVVELSKSVDAKKGKVGDQVIARLTEDVRLQWNVVAPYRSSKLVGHVTQVQARGLENPQSTLGITFDKIVLKGGKEIPVIAAVIRLMAPEHHMLPNRTISVPTSGDNPQQRASPAVPAPAVSHTQNVPSAPTRGSGEGATDIEGLTMQLTASGIVLTSIKRNVRLESDTLDKKRPCASD
jgi:hypothetical protein